MQDAMPRLVLAEKGYGKDAAGIAADAITFGLHFITTVSKHHFFPLLCCPTSCDCVAVSILICIDTWYG